MDGSTIIYDIDLTHVEKLLQDSLERQDMLLDFLEYLSSRFDFLNHVLWILFILMIAISILYLFYKFLNNFI